MNDKFIFGMRDLRLLVLLLAITFVQCKEEEEEEFNPDQQDVNTESYFEEVIKWNAPQERWEFFSWKGTNGANGCKIRINVHDAPMGSTVVNAFRPDLLKKGILNSIEIWGEAFEKIAIISEFQVRFASKNDALFTTFPRIDIFYEVEVDDGNSRGKLGAVADQTNRKFTHVHMHIAQLVNAPNGESRIMEENEYLSVIAHEMGHALGIYRFGGGNEHSSNKNDVMYSPSIYSKLSHGDIAVLDEVYSREAYYKP